MTVDDLASCLDEDIPIELSLVVMFNRVREKGAGVQELKKFVPESFLQRRVVVTNYKTLRNIYQQRLSHKLPEWQIFCKRIKESLAKPEWVYR